MSALMFLISQVAVELGPRRYEVLIAPGLVSHLGELLRARGLKQTNAFVITNAEVAGHYFAPVEASLKAAGFQRIVQHDIPSTEEGKNWEVFSRVCAAMLEAFPDAGASPLVFLLGGGVVGDLGGFAAAVFRRGVPFVQIPTTLLAAVDSSVGGKVAVNFGGVKNIMGAFSQPGLVVCDLSTLNTLSDRELRSGTSEIIKYGAVCSATLFEQLERGELEKLLARDPGALVDIVTQCVAIKARVVEQDEFDKKGIRNVLNFGHTIGHGLELSADYALTHGEAISIGMIAATRIARELSMVDESFAQRLHSLVVRAGLPTNYSGHAYLFERVKRALQLDKKFREGRNVFVLPTSVGAWEQRENIEWALVDDAIRSAIE
jgi:3-dehydroquinate synthase